MSRIDTLLNKLCGKPTPANFRFSELRKVMSYFGYLESNKGATSGSRVKFYHPKTKAVLLIHKPHPGDEMVKAAVDSVVRFLKGKGQLKNSDLLHYKGYTARPEYSVEDRVFTAQFWG